MFNSTKKSLSSVEFARRKSGSYFFEDNNGKAVSINGGRYRAKQFFGITSAQISQFALPTI